MPVVVLPENLDLIMGEADMAAQMRTKGVNAMLAADQAKAIELSKILAAPWRSRRQKSNYFRQAVRFNQRNGA